jgi:serine/threonine protein kinase
MVDIDNEYTIHKILGSGTYGKVYSVSKKGCTNLYALKMCECDDNSYIDSAVMREISILKKINHPSFIKVYDVFLGQYEEATHMCILMEQADSTIDDYEFTDDNSTPCLLQLLDGMQYLLKLGFIHGDLNYSNILVINNSIKICDLGFVRRSYRPVDHDLPSTMMVRPLEMFQYNDTAISIKMDSWALGFIAYKMLFNKHVVNINEIEHLTPANFIGAICQTLGTPTPKLLIKLGLEEVLPLVKDKKCKSVTGTITDLAKRRFFNELFQYNPVKRPTVEGILTSKYIQNLCVDRGYQFRNRCDIGNEITNGSTLNTSEMFNLVEHISSLVSDDEMELLCLTIHNFNKVSRFIEAEYTLYLFTTFWITNKVVSPYIYKIDSIIEAITTTLNVEVSSNDIEKAHNFICDKLEWSLDPPTCYTFIDRVPEMYRRHYEFLNLVVTLMHIDTELSEFMKAYSLISILNKTFGVQIQMDKGRIYNYDEQFIITNMLKTAINDVEITEFLKKISEWYGLGDQFRFFMRGGFNWPKN